MARSISPGTAVSTSVLAGFSIEGGEGEGELRFLLLIVQARRFFYGRAPTAQGLIVALIPTKAKVKYKKKSNFSSFSSSFLPERQPRRYIVCVDAPTV